MEPLAPDQFPYEEFALHEQQCLERYPAFQAADSGVLVCRRMRAGAYFSAGCADAGRSLALQLGALRAGMEYAGDVPGFLEPWYGIGTVASAFGARHQTRWLRLVGGRGYHRWRGHGRGTRRPNMGLRKHFLLTCRRLGRVLAILEIIQENGKAARGARFLRLSIGPPGGHGKPARCLNMPR